MKTVFKRLLIAAVLAGSALTMSSCYSWDHHHHWDHHHRDWDDHHHRR